MIVREMDRTDVLEVISMANECWDKSHPNLKDEKWLKGAVSREDLEAFVAEENGELVGVGMAEFERDMAELKNIMIKEDYREDGVLTEHGLDTWRKLLDRADVFFAEATTSYTGGQEVLERGGFTPVRFCPNKRMLSSGSQIIDHSTIYYCFWKGINPEPTVIEEAEELMEHLNMGAEYASPKLTGTSITGRKYFESTFNSYKEVRVSDESPGIQRLAVDSGYDIIGYIPGKYLIFADYPPREMDNLKLTGEAERIMEVIS